MSNLNSSRRKSSLFFATLFLLVNCSGESSLSEEAQMHRFGSLVVPDDYVLARSPSEKSIQILLPDENMPIDGILDHYSLTGYEFLLIELTDTEIKEIRERDSIIINWLESNESSEAVEFDEQTGLYRVYRGDIRFRWYLTENVPLRGAADYVAECMETEVGSPNCILPGILVSDRFYTELTISIENIVYREEIMAFISSLVTGWQV